MKTRHVTPIFKVADLDSALSHYKEVLGAYWRSTKFWALLIAGWLIASMFLTVLARLFGSFDDMTTVQSWITGVSIHGLAVLAGFTFARSKVVPGNRPGFPVIVRSDGGRDAG